MLFKVTKVTMHKGFTFYGDYGNNQPSSPYQSDCIAPCTDGARFPKELQCRKIIGTVLSDIVWLDTQCFVRCNFVIHIFCQRVRFSARHMDQVGYGVINSLWCPVRLLMRLLPGFSLIELSVGLTGHKAGFHC